MRARCQRGGSGMGEPSIERITSPVWRPALAAGLTGSPGDAATSMAGKRLVTVGSEKAENATQKPTRASSRFIAGPAKIMSARFHEA